jgi:hypothetical protein
MKKAVIIGVLSLVVVSSIQMDFSGANGEISEPEIRSYEEAQAYYAPYIETQRKEMKNFFEENKDAFNGLYEYLIEGEFSTFSVKFDSYKGEYGWSTAGNLGKHTFAFLHRNPELAQAFEILAAGGLYKLAFSSEGTVTPYEDKDAQGNTVRREVIINQKGIEMTYSYAPAEDKLRWYDLVMLYTRNIDIEVSANLYKVEKLSDCWITAYALYPRGE